MFLIFNFWSWIFDKSSKFWAALCKNESNLRLVRITVCIESCLPIGWRTFIWWKNPLKKVQFYFGLDCGMMECFTCELQSKEQLTSLPHFWSTVRRKRSRFEHTQTVNRTSSVRGPFAWSGLELWSCFKYSRSKLKTYSGWCPFQGLSNGSTLVQIVYCFANLAEN